MNINDKPEETVFAEAVNSDAYKAWQGTNPEEKEAVIAEPEKTQESKPEAPEKTAESTISQDKPTEKPAKLVQAKAEKEPFAGFNDLPDNAKAQIRALTEERNRFKRNYDLQTSRLAPLQRQFEELRRNAPGQTPAQQQTELKRTLEKWEKHKADFPDDAGAIEEAIQARAEAIQAQIDQKYSPLIDRLNRAESALTQLATKEHQEQVAQSHAVLDETASNWRQIAGWVVDGHEVDQPPDGATYHPAFVSWVNSHDPDVAQYLWQSLSHPSPRVAGRIFSDFNRAHFGESGDTPPPNPATERRLEARTDVIPKNGAAVATLPPAANGFFGQSEEEKYRAAVASEAYRKWRNV